MKNDPLKKAWQAKKCGPDSKPATMDMEKEQHISLSKFQLADGAHPGPDWIAESILNTQVPAPVPNPDEQSKSIFSRKVEKKSDIATVPLQNLPDAKNHYQVSYTDQGTPWFGRAFDLCNRPWLFHEHDGTKTEPSAADQSIAKASSRDSIARVPTDSLFEARYPKPQGELVESLCLQAKELADQEPLFPTGRVRLPFRSYKELRTTAIRKFDSRPCADPALAEWDTKRQKTTDLFPLSEQALSTQQCFICVRTRSGQFGLEEDLEAWRCPVKARREGLVIGLAAEHLDSRRTCGGKDSGGKDNAIKYSESVCACFVCVYVCVCVCVCVFGGGSMVSGQGSRVGAVVSCLLVE